MEASWASERSDCNSGYSEKEAEQEEKGEAADAESSDDSEYQVRDRSDTDTGSDTSDEEAETEEKEERQMPVSRSASIAKQVKLDEFLTTIIAENNLTPRTNWGRNPELYNIIESMSMRMQMRMTTTDLKRAVKLRVMSGVQ